MLRPVDFFRSILSLVCSMHHWIRKLFFLYERRVNRFTIATVLCFFLHFLHNKWNGCTSKIAWTLLYALYVFMVFVVWHKYMQRMFECSSATTCTQHEFQQISVIATIKLYVLLVFFFFSSRRCSFAFLFSPIAHTDCFFVSAVAALQHCLLCLYVYVCVLCWFSGAYSFFLFCFDPIWFAVILCVRFHVVPLQWKSTNIHEQNEILLCIHFDVISNRWASVVSFLFRFAFLSFRFSVVVFSWNIFFLFFFISVSSHCSMVWEEKDAWRKSAKSIRFHWQCAHVSLLYVQFTSNCGNQFTFDTVL